jgi:hypothetical protein
MVSLQPFIPPASHATHSTPTMTVESICTDQNSDKWRFVIRGNFGNAAYKIWSIVQLRHRLLVCLSVRYKERWLINTYLMTVYKKVDVWRRMRLESDHIKLIMIRNVAFAACIRVGYYSSYRLLVLKKTT